MRTIPVPPPIDIMDPQTGEHSKTATGENLTISLFDFLKRNVLTDAGWGAGVDMIYIGHDIRTKVLEAEAAQATSLDLSEDEWKKVCDILRAPKSQWIVPIMMQYVPFLRAITNAPIKAAA